MSLEVEEQLLPKATLCLEVAKKFWPTLSIRRREDKAVKLMNLSEDQLRGAASREDLENALLGLHP